MGAPSKRAKIVRKANEFDLKRLTQQLYMPRDGRNTIEAWCLEDIYAARQEQMLGQFVRPARMAEQFRTDDALYTAWVKRLAPQNSIPVRMKAAPGVRGRAVADEADALYGANGVALNAAVVQDIHSCLANHGIAFAAVMATPREDGSRVDLEAKYWPIEYIRWDPVFRVFKARADPNSVAPGDIPENANLEYGFVGGYWIPIIHGDGRWIIFKKGEIEPFRQEAALLPAALIWARHAFAARDWAQASKSHGSPKVIGELPLGVPLQDAEGHLTAEAAAMIELLKDIGRSNSPVGLRPAGSKTDYIVNSSTAWQVWERLLLNAERVAARVYLGTDGTLGTTGGSPGVAIEELFGVEKTIIRGDLEAISRGINTGLIAPWCAINFGDSKLAPQRVYAMPNEEREAKTKAYAERNQAYFTALQAAKSAGLVLDPVYIQQLAKDYRVRVPLISAQAPASPNASA